MIYGIHAVTEAIRAGKEIDKLFLQEGLKSDLSAELRRITKENDVLYVMVPGAKLDRIAAGKNHQGCVAFISSITYFQIEELLPTILKQAELHCF